MAWRRLLSYIAAMIVDYKNTINSVANIAVITMHIAIDDAILEILSSSSEFLGRFMSRSIQ